MKAIREKLLSIAGISRAQGWEAVLLQGSGTFGVEAVFLTGVPPEAGWLSGQTCFSPHELGDCDTPEQAIQALKSWVSKD